MTLSELHGGELYVVCFQFVSQFPMLFVVGLFCGFFPRRKVTSNPNIYMYSVSGWEASSGRRIVTYLRIENKLLHQCQLKKRGKMS